MALGNIDGMPQVAAPSRPRWAHFMGRLVWVFPKDVKPPANGMTESVICDVAFFDGGPMTHITAEDGTMTPLAQPVQPGEVVEDVYVGSTRIKQGLKDAIGKHDGFVVRVAKDGNAVVLRKATPEEEAYGARWVEQHRGQQQRVAAAADPFAAAQQQLAAQQPPQGMPAQYGQQFAVPPPGYGAQAPQLPPQAFPPGPSPQPTDPWAPQNQQQPAPVGHSSVQTGNGWQAPPQAAPGAYGAPQAPPVQQPPAPPAPQSAPPMTPEQWAAQQFGGGFSGQPPL